jgi:hypothetical protein
VSGTYSAALGGRPRARSVPSSPSRFAVRSTHTADPPPAGPADRQQAVVRLDGERLEPPSVEVAGPGRVPVGVPSLGLGEGQAVYSGRSPGAFLNVPGRFQMAMSLPYRYSLKSITLLPTSGTKLSVFGSIAPLISRPERYSYTGPVWS